MNENLECKRSMPTSCSFAAPQDIEAAKGCKEVVEEMADRVAAVVEAWEKVGSTKE